jgi:Flp pilus assembly protein TadD
MPTGILIAERTLFLPSLGVVALAALGIRGIGLRFGNRSLGRVGMLVVPGALLILGASRSITRVADWRSNESLFTAAVRDEPQVYRSHYMLGAWYLETGRWNDGERELRTAMALFGGDPAVAYNLGIVDFMNRRFAQATRMFQVVDSLMPGALSAKTKIALSLALQGKFDEAQTIALQALQESPADSATARALVQAADLEARIRARQSAR